MLSTPLQNVSIAGYKPRLAAIFVSDQVGSFHFPRNKCIGPNQEGYQNQHSSHRYHFLPIPTNTKDQCSPQQSCRWLNVCNHPTCTPNLSLSTTETPPDICSSIRYDPTDPNAHPIRVDGPYAPAICLISRLSDRTKGISRKGQRS